MERTRRDTLLGLVFFGTLAFLLWATVNLTDMSLAGVPPLVVYFPDAGSAEAGTNVMVLGKKVGKVGSIDFLINVAGGPVAPTRTDTLPPLRKGTLPFEDISEAEWAKVIAANLTTAFLVCREFAPKMKARDRETAVARWREAVERSRGWAANQ